MRLLTPWLIPQDTLSLKGRSVLLRQPVMDDFPEWRELRLASRNFLEPWEPSWDDRELTRSFFRSRLSQYRTLVEDDHIYAFFVFTGEPKRLCGGVTLSNIRRGVAQTGTLGYWIGERYARQGLMTDTINALLSYAFGDLGLHRVEAACLPNNEASIRLLIRTGFEREGYAKAYLKIAGRWQDHILFAKLSG